MSEPKGICLCPKCLWEAQLMEQYEHLKEKVNG